MKVSWFSAGVSSAVATKLALEKYSDMEIIYNHIDDQHEDTMRFIYDCEKWFGKKINILQSPLRNVENAVTYGGYIIFSGNAHCSKFLKRRVRKEWECDNIGVHTYIWGFDLEEKNRAEKIIESNPEFLHEFPLIEKGLTKKDVHGIIEKAGIKRPYMYDLGYPNNNCIGCVKGGAGYWNKIRQDFPDVFKKRAEMERRMGCTILKNIYLDELKKESGRKLKIIVPDCGFFCDILE